MVNQKWGGKRELKENATEGERKEIKNGENRKGIKEEKGGKRRKEGEGMECLIAGPCPRSDSGCDMYLLRRWL